jgi:hypothetical protein
MQKLKCVFVARSQVKIQRLRHSARPPGRLSARFTGSPRQLQSQFETGIRVHWHQFAVNPSPILDGNYAVLAVGMSSMRVISRMAHSAQYSANP